ncbi:MAG: energy transducer TonB [Hyphomonas sp.]|uniref:energy transducer TonB n=1 Tax=Hyphomonas sp. TaxID=87 RepID=UPI0025C618AE|nr:energy transducer TonB [Hyphomonas sp.]MBA4339343.1 energy transducer TonB [Hyphomonas sp.]
MRLTLNEASPRLSMAMLLALPLVYALFLAASWLIEVDDVTLPVMAERPLSKITPQSDDTLSDPVRSKLALTTVDKPPPPPRPSVETRGSAPVFNFPAPDNSGFEISKIKPPAVQVTALAGRNIQVVRAPAPSVPSAAITRGISGSCDVLFDVDTRGRPFNLTAQCTDDIFRAEAIRAVSKAEFLPKVSQSGVAVEQQGAIYPIAFEVN